MLETPKEGFGTITVREDAVKRVARYVEAQREKGNTGLTSAEVLYQFSRRLDPRLDFQTLLGVLSQARTIKLGEAVDESVLLGFFDRISSNLLSILFWMSELPFPGRKYPNELSDFNVKLQEIYQGIYSAYVRSAPGEDRQSFGKVVLKLHVQEETIAKVKLDASLNFAIEEIESNFGRFRKDFEIFTTTYGNDPKIGRLVKALGPQVESSAELYSIFVREKSSWLAQLTRDSPLNMVAGGIVEKLESIRK